MPDIKEKPRASASADGVDQVPVLTGGGGAEPSQRTWKSYLWSCTLSPRLS